MADEEQPFRYLTNDEFLALSRAEKLKYLASAILLVTREEEGQGEPSRIAAAPTHSSLNGKWTRSDYQKWTRSEPAPAGVA